MAFALPLPMFMMLMARIGMDTLLSMNPLLAACLESPKAIAPPSDGAD